MKTKLSNLNLNKKEDTKAIERRYVDEIEAKQRTQQSLPEVPSPIIRSSMKAKMTK